MKRSGIIALVCAAALVLSFALAGCSSLMSEPYTPQGKSAEVSSPTIGKDGVLRVGVNTGNPPLAGSPSDSIIGIDVDVAAALADELGLKLSVVDVKTDYEGALADGTIDIALGVDSTAVSANVWASDIYLPTTVALFSTSSTAGAPASGSSVKIGAQISSVSAWAVTNEFGSSSLVTEASLASAFKDLASGAVDYVASDVLVGAYSAHTSGIDVYVAALVQKPAGYCIAVSKSNTSLQTAINAKIKNLDSGGIIKLIERKWLGTSLDLDSAPLTPGATSASTTTTSSSDSSSESALASNLSTGDIASNAIQQ